MARQKGEKTTNITYPMTDTIKNKLDELLAQTHYRTRTAIIDQAIAEMHEKMKKELPVIKL